jgi:hypothetical protein
MYKNRSWELVKIENGKHCGFLKGGSMKRLIRILSALSVLMTAGAIAPDQATASDLHSFTASLLGGVGGSLDEDASGFSNSSWQLGFGIRREVRTHFGLRLGSVDFGRGAASDPLSSANLDYLILGGEYRTEEGLYESGMFLGLGLYELDGMGSERAIGLALGVTGDFELTKRWTVLVEIAGHVTKLEAAEVFATGLAGVAFHF